MSHPNSAWLRSALHKAGWQETADLESFVIEDEAKFKSHMEMLRPFTAPDILLDRTAFWYLTHTAVKDKVDQVPEHVLATQHKQLTERANKQKEHEAALIGELAKVVAGLATNAAQNTSQHTAMATETVTAADSLKRFLQTGFEAQAKRDTEKGLALDILMRRQTADKLEIAAGLLSLPTRQDMQKVVRKILVGLGVIILLILALAIRGHAQQANTNPAIVVATCGTSTLPSVGSRSYETVLSDGRLCIGPITVSGTVTTNQGTANTAANRWPVYITDGTNTMPTGDAAARTIHITADNASLPVTQSETWNIATVTAVTAITNALPAGSNVIGHIIADTGSTTAVTGNVTVVQPTGTNLHTVTDSGTITTVSSLTAIANALPAGTNILGAVNPVAATSTDKSGVITLGGTAQQLAASNASRKRLTIQNYTTATAQGIATAESLWISFTGTAVCGGGTGTFEVTPGNIVDTGPNVVTTQAVSVCAATTNHKWQAAEQ